MPGKDNETACHAVRPCGLIHSPKESFKDPAKGIVVFDNILVRYHEDHALSGALLIFQSLPG